MLGDLAGLEIHDRLAVQGEAVLPQRGLDVRRRDARVGRVDGASTPAHHAGTEVIELAAERLDLLVCVAQLLAELVVLLPQPLELVGGGHTGRGRRRSRRRARGRIRHDARRRAVEDHESAGGQPPLLDPLVVGLPVVVERRRHLAAVQGDHDQTQHLRVALLHAVVLDGVAAVRGDVLQHPVEPVAIADADGHQRDVGRHLGAVAPARGHLDAATGRFVADLAAENRRDHLAQIALGPGREELEEVLPEQLVAGPAEPLLGVGVPGADLALLVE